MEPLFPDIKRVPCESKLDAFSLLNKIAAYFEAHFFMTVEDYYKMLELEPIPESASHYCWMGVSDFAFVKEGNAYFVRSLEPIQIIEHPVEEVQ